LLTSKEQALYNEAFLAMKQLFKRRNLNIVVFLNIILHIPNLKKTLLWEKIYETFHQKDKKIKSLLNYFQKHWLKSYTVEMLTDRTNNVSESYNAFLQRHFEIVHPRLSIFISKIIEIENLHKNTLVNYFIAGSQNGKKETEPQLPFKQALDFIEKNLEKLGLDSSIDAIKKTDAFMQIEKLTKKCYDFFFSDCPSDGQLDSLNEEREILSNNEEEEFKINEVVLAKSIYL